jgi:circadian clock protein KaiB
MNHKKVPLRLASSPPTVPLMTDTGTFIINGTERAAMTAAATLCTTEPIAEDPEYVLRLFVTGFTPCSQRAIDNLRNICEHYLAGRYRMEVVDLYQSPGLAHDEQIVAIPTLLKVQPFPPRRVIGDLSQVDKVLRGLDIK